MLQAPWYWDELLLPRASSDAMPLGVAGAGSKNGATRLEAAAEDAAAMGLSLLPCLEHMAEHKHTGMCIGCVNVALDDR